MACRACPLDRMKNVDGERERKRERERERERETVIVILIHYCVFESYCQRFGENYSLYFMSMKLFELT